MAARRLQALAEDLARQPPTDEGAAIVINAFRAAARALESACDPPPRAQVLALVQVLTAGFEKLSAGAPAGSSGDEVRRPSQREDPLRLTPTAAGRPNERLRITLWSGTGR